jgi:hypothetical protein
MTCSHPTRYHEASQGVTVCLLCEIERLQADNKRLADFAAGRGMASEADGPEEIAVLVCGLHDRAERLERECDGLRGELARAIQTTPEDYDWSVLDRAFEAGQMQRELDNARADHAIIADITVDGDNMDPDEMRREVHKIAALASRGHSGIKEADELRLTCRRLHAELERVITALAHDSSHCIPEALEQSKRILAETKETLGE